MTSERNLASPGKPTTRDRFGVMFPELRHLANVSLDSPVLVACLERGDDDPLLSWLRRASRHTVADMLDEDPHSLLTWPGIGPGKADKIIKYLQRIAGSTLAILERLAMYPEPGQSPVPEPVTDPDLLLLALWAQFRGGENVWGDVEAAAVTGQVPDEVERALRRLRARPVGLVRTLPSAEDVLGAWLSALDARRRAIVQERLTRSPARTFSEIARSHGVSRPHIHAIDQEMRREIADLLACDDWRPVRWEAFDLQQQLGAYAPIDPSEVEELSHAVALPRAVLFWLAGYDRTGERLIRRGFTLPEAKHLPLVEGTPRLDEPLLHDDLRSRGVVESHLEWAVDSIPGVGRVDGAAVLWPDTVIGQAKVVLALRGVPMTAEELSTALGRRVNLKSLRQRLYRDPLVRRVSPGHVGLRVWPEE